MLKTPFSTFVIAPSYSGKTPYAKALAEKTGRQHISAGGWARAEYPIQHDDKAAFIQGITAYSLQQLKGNQNRCLDWMASQKDPLQSAVYEGVRNPRDFAALFTWNDEVVFLNYTKNPLVATQFESGILVIKNYVEWLQRCGFITQSQYKTLDFDCFFEKEKLGNETSLESYIQKL